jgi:hypothetical protein
MGACILLLMNPTKQLIPHMCSMPLMLYLSSVDLTYYVMFYMPLVWNDIKTRIEGHKSTLPSYQNHVFS